MINILWPQFLSMSYKLQNLTFFFSVYNLQYIDHELS